MQKTLYCWSSNRSCHQLKSLLKVLLKSNSIWRLFSHVPKILPCNLCLKLHKDKQRFTLIWITGGTQNLNVINIFCLFQRENIIIGMFLVAIVMAFACKCLIMLNVFYSTKCSDALLSQVIWLLAKHIKIVTLWSKQRFKLLNKM